MGRGLLWVRLGRADHPPRGGMCGRCSPVSGPIRGGQIGAALGQKLPLLASFDYVRSLLIWSLHFLMAEGQIDRGDALPEWGATEETCHEKAVAGHAFDGCRRLRVLLPGLFPRNRYRNTTYATSDGSARGGRRCRGNLGAD